MATAATIDNTTITTDSSSSTTASIVDDQLSLCQTPNCSNIAKLRCPTCMKLNIDAPSHFCSQVSICASTNRYNLLLSKTCFKGNWNEHKKVHTTKKLIDSVNAISVADANYNPWPSYAFTGTLRPYPQVCVNTHDSSMNTNI